MAIKIALSSPEKLMTMSPRDVDEEFAAVWEEEYRLKSSRARAYGRVMKMAGAKQSWSGAWTGMNLDEALASLRETAGRVPGSSAGDMVKEWDRIDGELLALWGGPEAVLTAEFDRREGWGRAYLVTDGHVHRSTNCSSCNKGAELTKFTWMIEYSGKTEKEIVQAAGDRACTICYPSAPVAKGLEAPKSVMFTPEEIDRAAERDRLVKRKAEIAAAKAAKAITDVDGEPLKVYTWTKRAHQKRHRRTGEIVDVPEQEFFDALPTLHQARAWLTGQFEEWRGNTVQHRDFQKVARAVAAKEGKDEATVIAEAEKRYKNRK